MKHYLGIDMGGTNIAVGVIDETYRFVAKHNVKTNRQQSFQQTVAEIAAAGKKALEMAGLTEKDIDYIGVVVPSTIHPKTKNIVFANNLGWKDCDFLGEFKKSWDIPICLANDADGAALGEVLAGAAVAYNSALMLTLGTGVGGSIILDNKLFLGGDGIGLEPGHSTIVAGGVPCTCGQKGCLESYASVTALIRETIVAMGKNPRSLMCEMCDYDIRKVNGRLAFDAAKKGDASAIAVVDEYIFYLANGIASFITTLRPEVIILGGGISNECDEMLFDPLRKKVFELYYEPVLLGVPPIIRAKLGNDAGIIGAALLGAQDKL